MKKFILSIATALFVVGAANAQVGIGTTTPNGATVLDIESNSKGILIPRLSDLERNSSLADNDLATIPPAGVANSALQVGTLIFNTTENEYQYWDGSQWKAVSTTTAGGGAGNDGSVRVDGFGAPVPNQTRPSLTVGGNNALAKDWKTVFYNSPLSLAPAPTTTWPANSPGTSDIFIYRVADSTFVENPTSGQVHIWRVNIEYTLGSGAAAELQVRLINPSPLSQFQTAQTIRLIGSNATTNVVTVVLFTIADDLSIVNPLFPDAKGYKLQLKNDNNQAITVTVRDVARISLFKN
jgi:hypothetical protein